VSTETKNKPKVQKTAIPIHKQKPDVRRKNFNEVALGYTEEEALSETARCLQCKQPKCVSGCPVEIDIPSFIELLKAKQFKEAIRKIKEKNCLPAVCGRVCPQEEQCQKFCLLGKIGDPVSIGRLERFLADWERQSGIECSTEAPPTGKRVAIIGAGPASLTAAADLAKLGHDVVLYEALHYPGGVLMYGIPEFRLPKSIVQAEADYVKKLGVKIRVNCLIGRTFTIPELLKTGFDAVFIGTGAGLPRFLGVQGENLSGIYSSNEFLIRVNFMKSFTFPACDTPIKIGKKVAVIGGGNVAIDSARSALRLGAEEAFIVYRRSREELPARKEEVENAEEEGIIFKFLTNPKRFVGDEKGWVKAIECISMDLGPADSSGRRRPIPVNG
jgi:glutamate synthase (NADPH/NADH) small chain